MDTFSYRELQKGCKALQLKASGTKAALFWRIVIALLHTSTSARRSELVATLEATGIDMDVGLVVTSLEQLDADSEALVRNEVAAAGADAVVNENFVKVCIMDVDEKLGSAVLDALERIFGYRHHERAADAASDGSAKAATAKALGGKPASPSDAAVPDARPADAPEQAAQTQDQGAEDTTAAAATLKASDPARPVTFNLPPGWSEPSPHAAKRGRTPANTPSTAVKAMGRRKTRGSRAAAAAAPSRDDAMSVVQDALRIVESTLAVPSAVASTSASKAGISARRKKTTPGKGKRVNFALAHEKAFSAQKAIGTTVYNPSTGAARALSFAGVDAAHASEEKRRDTQASALATRSSRARSVGPTPATSVGKKGSNSATPTHASGTRERRQSSATASWRRPSTFKIHKSDKKPTKVQEFRLSFNKAKEPAAKAGFTPYTGAVSRLPAGTPASLIFDRENAVNQSANQPLRSVARSGKAAASSAKRGPVKKTLGKQIEQRRKLQNSNARTKRQQKLDEARAAAMAS